MIKILHITKMTFKKQVTAVLTRCFHSNIVVWIDADVLFLQAKCIFTVVNCLQLVMVIQIGPAPQTAVNNMRQSFLLWHLQTTIQWSKNNTTSQDTALHTNTVYVSTYSMHSCAGLNHLTAVQMSALTTHWSWSALHSNGLHSNGLHLMLLLPLSLDKHVSQHCPDCPYSGIPPHRAVSYCQGYGY